MTDKFLRGKAPLTIWRGAMSGPGGHLYRGGLLEPNQVDPKNRDRLVAEGFLEWVVRDGEQFKLAEDTSTGEKGDPVTVGDSGVVPASETDPGTVNLTGMELAEAARLAEVAAESDAAAMARADAEVAEKRAAAKAKLPADGSAPHGNASRDVWVEFLAGKGYDYSELAKQENKADLIDLAK